MYDKRQAALTVKISIYPLIHIFLSTNLTTGAVVHVQITQFWRMKAHSFNTIKTIGFLFKPL